jgi:hypothetical protein
MILVPDNLTTNTTGSPATANSAGYNYYKFETSGTITIS